MTIQHFAGQPVDINGAMSSEPRPLPYAAYPKAGDVARHGIQPLPASLPIVDFAQAKPYRGRYSTVVATDLTPARLLQMAWVIATSFVRHEPQARHLRPPKHPPAGLMEARHTDPLGSASFGEWDAETLMYWLIRLSVLTGPTSPQGAIEVNEEILAQSLAIVDERGQVIGGAFNETMPACDHEPGEFFEKIIGAMEMACVYLGDRLGLYEALADHGPAAPAELAERTGTYERYPREWPEQQAIMGILEVEDAVADGSARRFGLPAARKPRPRGSLGL